MAGQADFSEADWKRICRGPAAAALYVSYASRGGAMKTVKETKAIAAAYERARKGGAVGQLLREAVADYPVIGADHNDSIEDIRQRLIDDVGAAWALVERHAHPSEAGEYRQFLLEIAQAVAAAAKGIDPDEANALSAIEAALRPARWG
ncbi:MAG TPA: hypothetical protein VIL04_00095 [Solirubrobacterales bacterium]